MIGLDFSPTDLQAARKAAAERFYAIGMSYLPAGWTYAFRKSLSGNSDPRKKHINGPKPITRKALYVWLHECGHANLHADGKRRPRHVEELEAEQFAHATMRKHGIPVPRISTKTAKYYVAHQIRKAEKRGAKNIDAKARAFTKGK